MLIAFIAFLVVTGVVAALGIGALRLPGTLADRRMERRLSSGFVRWTRLRPGHCPAPTHRGSPSGRQMAARLAFSRRAG